MDRYPRSDSIVQGRTGLQTYMAQVYGWMTVGLLLTAFIAWFAANTPAVMMFVFSSKITFFGLIIAQLALVFVLSGMVQRLSAGMATTLFMLYSALTGLTLSSIFIAYTYSSIASTFVVTGGMFGAMSLYGYTTKRDLSGFGSMLFMGLIGIVLASLVNLWLKSEALMWAVTYIGVVLFVGLTAYDTQKLKNIGEQIDTRDSATLRKYSILGALTLYLDFINLFLMLLRIMGNRRSPFYIKGLHLRTPGKRSAAGRDFRHGTLDFAGWRLRLTRPTGSSHRLTLRRPVQAQRGLAVSFAGQLALVLLP